MTRALRTATRFLASYGLACALFILMMLLTYFGTLYQVEHGLYQAQQRYFSSFFLIHRLFGVIPLTLPGGYLLIIVLFINLLLGGIVLAPKGWSRLGLLTVHGGICFLLLGAFVTHEFSVSGHLTLYEGEESDTFQAYHEWELALLEVRPGETVTEYAIPDDRLPKRGVKRFVTGADAPMVEVWGYRRNTVPEEDPETGAFRLVELPAAPQNEQNLPGAYVALVAPDGETRAEGIAWGGAAAPLTLDAGGEAWRVGLRRRVWELPFSVTLEEFTRELHPGTHKPRSFRSEVTKLEDGVAQRVEISMNEPLRSHGYTLYQSSWGPADAPPGTPLYSVFAVVRNPVERLPLYATLVITAGLLLHFTRMLLLFIKRHAAATRKAAAFVLAAGLACVAATGAHAAEPPAPPVLSEQTAALLERLPVQDGGRVKPLNTFAAVTLLRFNGKRTCAHTDGRKLSPVEWLADVLFFPDRARDYRVFSIDNSDVLVAMQVPFTRRRDRYSYNDLAPGRARLLALARQYASIPLNRRAPAQNQLVNLAHNLIEFERLTGYLDFARTPPGVDAAGPLARVFPGTAAPPLSEVLRKAPELVAAVRGTGDAGHEAAIDYIRRLDHVVGDAVALQLLPPPPRDLAREEWDSPASLADRAFHTGLAPADAQLELLALLEGMARTAGDHAAFHDALTAFHGTAVGIAEARNEYGRAGLEVALYKLRPFQRALAVFVLSFVVIAFSLLVPRRRSLYRAGFALVFAALVLLAAGIAMRAVIRGRPPVTTLYETILFSAFVAAATGLFIEAVNRQRVALFLASVLGALGLFIANKYEIREGVDTMPSMVAVLDTNFWLATHVTTIIIGYGAGFLASALGHVHVFGRLFRLRAGDKAFYNQLARMVYGVVCFSLVFTILGTVLGGVWANESWGRFWGWDPKENGALMIVLWQLALLHGRRGGYLRGYGMSLGAIFGGIVIVFAWFGVNMLGVGLHSYGFTTGIQRTLLAFYSLQAFVIALGAAVWFRENRPSPPRPGGV